MDVTRLQTSSVLDDVRSSSKVKKRIFCTVGPQMMKPLSRNVAGNLINFLLQHFVILLQLAICMLLILYVLNCIAIICNDRMNTDVCSYTKCEIPALPIAVTVPSPALL